ncbi:hypothetical protein Ddye_021185 [Dipteronia dyeriana]|uniref:Uncharacterized protein n=1 Tax=Dipteronia dyeriana TaxID=168575 RepID=A0AAD9WXR3_9ROSI|nr:hypothetical protein Ddye_021185 [Dipteronia dyeriana]
MGMEPGMLVIWKVVQWSFQSTVNFLYQLYIKACAKLFLNFLHQVQGMQKGMLLDCSAAIHIDKIGSQTSTCVDTSLLQTKLSLNIIVGLFSMLKLWSVGSLTE